MAKQPKTPTYPTEVTPDEQDILKTAVERYDLAWQHEEHNINEAYDDLQFIAGEQWEPSIAKERQTDGRPMLTVNMLPKFIKQITGDMRMNKPAIKVRPVGGGADKDRAEIYTGLIRNIETLSDASTVYTRGGESASRCGIGGWVIETDYSDDDAFLQNIRLKYISDPLNILFDPDAKEISREDAKWAFWVRAFSYDAYKLRWPDAKVSSWDAARTLGMGTDWYNEDEVKVAWYWVKKPIAKTLGQMADGSVVDMATHDGEPPLKTRIVNSHKVCQYVITASEILEGPIEWAGKYIPIVPVIGEEIPIENRTVRHGAIRWAKDPQRMYNYHQSTAVEAHALAPKAPFILTADQVKGREAQWRQANRRNLPYLTYNPDGTAPPPQRSSASTDISASMALADKSENDMYATIGIYPPSLGAKSNEQSGKAILARQREADVGSYVYIDNLAKAIAYTGRQLIDLIPHIYDTQRVIRILAEDGTEDEVVINQPGMDGQFMNDMTVGKYDVVVETGPSFTTKRQESAQAMQEFAAQNGQVAGVVMDLIAEAQDWPNADKFAQRFKMTLPPGIDPEVDQLRQQAQANQPPPPPDPKVMADQMKAEIEGKRLQLDERRLALDEQAARAEVAIAQAEQSRKNAETQIDAARAAMERRDMELTHREAAAKIESDHVISLAQNTPPIPPDLLQPIAQALGDLARTNQQVASAILQSTGPKRVVRDQAGNVVGIEPLN